MDDGAGAGTVGNGNGYFDCGETVDITLTLENYGESQASDVTGTLVTEDPYATILEETQSFGTIPSGGSAASQGPYRFSISEECPNGHYIDFGVDVTASGGYGWTNYFTVRVIQPNIVFLTFGLHESAGNGDDLVDPGESGTLHLLLGNGGLRGTAGVTAVLETDDPDIVITGSDVQFPDMDLSEVAQNLGPESRADVTGYQLFSPGSIIDTNPRFGICFVHLSHLCREFLYRQIIIDHRMQHYGKIVKNVGSRDR